MYFSTYMTGELFAVLRQHSILGRLLPETREPGGEPNRAAFELGLAEAQRSLAGDLAHQIFATRTLGLTGRLPHDALVDYLSGLLIGSELVSGLARFQNLSAVPPVSYTHLDVYKRQLQSHFSHFNSSSISEFRQHMNASRRPENHHAMQA